MKTKIERSTEIHRTMTPHQMALRIVELEDIAEIVGQSASERSKRIVELQDALELADEAVRAKQQAVPVAPTSAMLTAAGAATPRYRAMLAAAPKPVAAATYPDGDPK